MLQVLCTLHEPRHRAHVCCSPARSAGLLWLACWLPLVCQLASLSGPPQAGASLACKPTCRTSQTLYTDSLFLLTPVTFLSGGAIEGLELPKRVFPCATPREVRSTLPTGVDVLAFQCR